MERYKSESNHFCVYILKIADKPIFKIGKTNKLKYRVINLNQAIYEDWDFYKILSFNCNEDALKVERLFQKELYSFRIKREWFKCAQHVIDDVYQKLVAMALYELDTNSVSI